MEVNRSSFPSAMLDILDAISRAHFVSFDLELSGVASKRNGGPGKPSLQQRYEETKRAAEQFQILQVGLTCVEENYKKGSYIARPYNFNLCPVVEKELNIERTFTFQSDAAYFLLEHGFNFDLPFREGVPYLSRNEAALARKAGLDRLDRSIIPDIQLKVEDVQALGFLTRVRNDINTWLETRKVTSLTFLNIAPVGHDTDNPLTRPELSKFEKRLVHQLLRAEYPDLRSFSKGSFIQIVPLDQERENATTIHKIRRMQERISRETGFRWLVEAMAGGDLSTIDPKSFAFSATGENICVDMQQITTRFQKTQARLKQRRTVLVGHNLFTDLICIFGCFLGELPERVEDFQQIIHALFPLIIDTKYLATHNCGDINPSSSLAETEQQLREEQVPAIEIPFEFSRYLNSSAYHEAGYDSFLTAKILVRLSTQLEQSGKYKTGPTGSPRWSEDEHYHTAKEEISGDDASSTERADFKVHHKAHPSTGSETSVSGSNGNTPSSALSSPSGTSRKASRSAKKQKAKLRGEAATFKKSKFSHTTLFDQLRTMNLEDDDHDSHEVAQNNRESGNSVSLPAIQGSALGTSTGTVTPIRSGTQTPVQRPGMMPPFESCFWKTFGNKLRVFGTVEGLCNLADS